VSTNLPWSGGHVINISISVKCVTTTVSFIDPFKEPVVEAIKHEQKSLILGEFNGPGAYAK
jgi:hypothetical protein